MTLRRGPIVPFIQPFNPLLLFRTWLTCTNININITLIASTLAAALSNAPGKGKTTDSSTNKFLHWKNHVAMKPFRSRPTALLGNWLGIRFCYMQKQKRGRYNLNVQ